MLVVLHTANPTEELPSFWRGGWLTRTAGGQARLRDDLNRLPDMHFYACIENIVIARDGGAASHTEPDYDVNLETLDPPCLRALQVLSLVHFLPCQLAGSWTTWLEHAHIWHLPPGWQLTSELNALSHGVGSKQAADWGSSAGLRVPICSS